MITSGVVLATLLDGSDRDYRVIIVKDCCADPDTERHTWLATKLFPRQTVVMEASELLNAMGVKEAPQG